MGDLLGGLREIGIPYRRGIVAPRSTVAHDIDDAVIRGGPREDSRVRGSDIDDHALVRQGIAVLVGTQRDMTLVAEASNGREAIQQFRTHRPDVTLMDLQMPEMNGFDAIVAIQGEYPI